MARLTDAVGMNAFIIGIIICSDFLVCVWCRLTFVQLYNTGTFVQCKLFIRTLIMRQQNHWIHEQCAENAKSFWLRFEFT